MKFAVYMVRRRDLHSRVDTIRIETGSRLNLVKIETGSLPRLEQDRDGIKIEAGSRLRAQ